MSGMAIFSEKVSSDLCVAMIHGDAVIVSLPIALVACCWDVCASSGDHLVTLARGN